MSLNTHQNTGPLAGLKVLDLSRVLAGPWASQVLADFGADIWKIENPNGGDETRHWGQQITQNVVAERAESSEKIEYKGDTTTFFLCANRGKYSLTVDISTPEGQLIIHDLASKADIVPLR